METTFTPISGLLGGILIGLASAGLLLADGKIAGISGILGRSLFPVSGDLGWRLAFLAGLPIGAWLTARVSPGTSEFAITGNTLLLVAGGLLVGFGTQLGSGCTSGHGVCGLARGSRRSLVATVTFMASAAITLFLARHVLGVCVMRMLAAALCGIVFGVGLALSGMTNPAKVLAFLDVSGHWDPTLACVMGGALAVSAAGFAVAGRSARPWFAAAFSLPTRRDLDRDLILGAVLFGVGWGLVGPVPGPRARGPLAGVERGVPVRRSDARRRAPASPARAPEVRGAPDAHREVTQSGPCEARAGGLMGLRQWLRGHFLDWAMRQMNELRPDALAAARGEVLEVGFGSGLNLAFYPPEVTGVVGIEPNPVEGLRALEERIRAARFPVAQHALRADGELPFDSGRFDCVVTTWTLCSIPDPVKALREMRRVLKPGGRLPLHRARASTHGGSRALAGSPESRVAPTRGRLQHESPDRCDRRERRVSERAHRALPAHRPGAAEPHVPWSRRRRLSAADHGLRHPGSSAGVASSRRTRRPAL